MVAMTVHYVIVKQTARLHPRINDGRATKLEPGRLEIF